MSYLIFSIMAIVALGYLLGRVTVKGVSLGTAGVFVVSLLYGAFFYDNLADAMKTAEIASHGLKIVENLGLVFFVTSVGFIAGPKFFKNLKNNFKSYIMVGFVIILAGGLTCVVCYLIGRNFESDNKQFLAMMDGLLSGSLTTTPGFSAAKETVKNFYAATPELASGYEDAVTVGHGIAYLFGVIGVVLFVQILPKLVHADMDEERRKLASVDTGEANTIVGKLINIDDMGLGAFGLAALIGIIIGNIKIPLTAQGFSGTCFSLTTTGGALITSLLFGHFSHIGRINIMPEKKTLEVLRELGLMIFLIGAACSDVCGIFYSDKGLETQPFELARLDYGRNDKYACARNTYSRGKNRGRCGGIRGNISDCFACGRACVTVLNSILRIINSQEVVFV